MPDELRILIKADDQASGTLREVRGALGDVVPAAQEAEVAVVGLGNAGDTMGNLMQVAGVNGARAIRQITNAVTELMVAAPELLLVAAALLAAFLAVKVAVEGIGFAFNSVMLALSESGTQIAAQFQGALNQVSSMWHGFSMTLGTSILQGIAPVMPVIVGAVRSILTSLSPLIPVIATIAAVGARVVAAAAAGVAEILNFLIPLAVNIGNTIIGIFNKIGPGVVALINKAVDGLNTILKAINVVRGVLGMSAVGLIPHMAAFSAIGQIAMPSAISFEAPQMPKFDSGGAAGLGPVGAGLGAVPSIGGGGGGGGGGAASAGGFGGTGGARATSPRATDAIEASQSTERLQLQTLERVDGRMQELIDLLRGLPEMTRDAIVVYTGGG